MEKKCNKCGEGLSIEVFWKDKSKKDGRRTICKECANSSRNEKYAFDSVYKEKLKERARNYQNNNKEKVSKKNKEYREKHLEELSQYQEKYREENKVELSQQKKEYYLKNRERVLAYRKSKAEWFAKYNNEYVKERKKVDYVFWLHVTMRGRFNHWIKSKGKSKAYPLDHGCSLEELKVYLESKFQPEMTWENRGWGKGKWHIDHVIPLVLFNPEDEQHMILAWHYMNLQPLWHEDNMKKSCRYVFTGV